MMELRTPNNQNLNNQSGADVDGSIWKIVFLAAIQVILIFVFSYYLKLFIESNNWIFFLIVFSAALGFLAFFFLNIFFVKTLWRSNLIVVLDGAAFTAGFYDKFSMPFLWGIVGGILFLMWGNYSGWAELQNLLKIKFWRISKRALPKAIVGLTLFASIACYVNIQESISAQSKEFFISEATFEKLISPAMPLAKKIVPEFDLSLTTDELLDNLARSQVEKNPEAQRLPETAKKLLMAQAVGSLKKQVEEWTGAPLEPKVKITQALYNVMLKKITDLPPKVKNAIPILAVTIIALTILGFSWAIRWVATTIAYLLYEILLALGFAVVAIEGRSREIILLK